MNEITGFIIASAGLLTCGYAFGHMVGYMKARERFTPRIRLPIIDYEKMVARATELVVDCWGNMKARSRQPMFNYMRANEGDTHQLIVLLNNLKAKHEEWKLYESEEAKRKA